MDKLYKINKKCEEKSYIIIKEIESVNDKEKIHLKNKEGYMGVINISKFLRNQQDVCWFSNKNPYMIENIKTWLNYNAKNLTLKSVIYKKSDEYLEFECCHHGLYMSTWDNIKAGYNCPKCKSDKIGMLKRKGLAEVEKVFIDKGYTPLFTEYHNGNEFLDAVNSEGYKISVSYASIKNSEPQIFGYKNKYTIDNIKLWLIKNGLEHIELISNEYVDAHTELELYCKKHNKTVYATWNNLSKGKVCRDCGIEKVSGENNTRYNPNLTDEEREIGRKYEEYYEWRKIVYERDNYRCIISKTKGSIVAHHLNGYNWDKEHRTDVDNGVTISKELHDEFHSIYGRGNNTLEQFREFYKDKTGKEFYK